ncbi:MAG: helix-turn-helix transcriptional regulator [Jatrophihabitans sp.]|uniref:helix-turn-helix transcriptional regulator n=1 Tax=Jatrophihabitans sp. TaxID=1932789 RepID=UPI003F804B32
MSPRVGPGPSAGVAEIRHTGVVKIAGTEQGTRDAVARLVLERGPQTAAALAEQLDLSPAAVRRHLDALVAEGKLVEREPRPSASRGRGRPARTYALTDAGRAAFPHGYDDLANTALRWLRETGGDAAVEAFAEHRAAQIRALVEAPVTAAPAGGRAEALASALSGHGYAATTDTVASGVQLCQHHCPVAHVAAEFPELCEAETRAFADVLGTYVQRLATIAHGDGVCTTHVPHPVVQQAHQAVPTTTRSGSTS